MQTKEVYIILYDNNEQYDEWSHGIMASSGVFETREMAEIEVKRLQDEMKEYVRKEVELGSCYVHGENTTYEILPITYHHNGKVT